ncbi:DUF899 family protein [Glaciimonas sp. PCH181]|uniref:DUF899 family protein n=1 Tax=Glaciimonas sp. PCH181 TaxID=2133943 RepID=UPI000D3A3307|nr:DUF899 family protein [Glaciimonas sp. PCH181]PUA18738.1 DUF899 domain-containing protein [Glaciimonas sp. PCH181]
MDHQQNLTPASELAKKNIVRFPNESYEYRLAREALLAEEIDLRRHIERVAEQRRALPPGGIVPKEYQFVGEDGPVVFSDLFGDKETLAIYSYMYGAQREQPCPMCTSLLSAWDGEAADVAQRIALVVVARSPIERLIAFKKQRGWQHLRLFSDIRGDYTRAYVHAEDANIPAFNVFTRRDGAIRHFWSGEMGFQTADPGPDPRGAPDLMPLWTILDSTPEGRGGNWYPKLHYPA